MTRRILALVAILAASCYLIYLVHPDRASGAEWVPPESSAHDVVSWSSDPGAPRSVRESVSHRQDDR